MRRKYINSNYNTLTYRPPNRTYLEDIDVDELDGPNIITENNINSINKSTIERTSSCSNFFHYSPDNLQERILFENVYDSLHCFICLNELKEPLVCPRCSRMCCEQCVISYIRKSKYNNLVARVPITDRFKCGICRSQISIKEMIKLKSLGDISMVFEKLGKLNEKHIKEKDSLTQLLSNEESNRKKDKNKLKESEELVKKLKSQLDNKEKVNKELQKQNKERENNDKNTEDRKLIQKLMEELEQKNKQYKELENKHKDKENQINQIKGENELLKSKILNMEDISSIHENSNLMIELDNDLAGLNPGNNRINNNLSNNKYEKNCPLHNYDILRHYCVDCNKGFCGTCFFLLDGEKEKHKGHRFVNYQNLQAIEIDSIKKSLEENSGLIKSYMKECENYLSSYDEELKNGLEFIEKIKEKFKERIDNNINSVKNTITQLKNQEDKILEKEKKIEVFFNELDKEKYNTLAEPNKIRNQLMLNENVAVDKEKLSEFKKIPIKLNLVTQVATLEYNIKQSTVVVTGKPFEGLKVFYLKVEEFNTLTITLQILKHKITSIQSIMNIKSSKKEVKSVKICQEVGEKKECILEYNIDLEQFDKDETIIYMEVFMYIFNCSD